MLFFKIIFLLSLLIIFYSYFGYGLVIWFAIKLRGIKPNIFPEHYEPEVTLVIAAYNEEFFLEEKIKNTLELDYPKFKLKLIFITDGSIDKSGDILKKYTRITHLHQDLREGKVAAIRRAMTYITTPIVIFSDANTYLNKESIKKIVRHYIDPFTGGVAGEKRIANTDAGESAGAGEGLYWRYESFLKKLDSEFYTVVGAAGELFSIRTALYEHPGDDTLLDDLVISLSICKKGYRIIYEPEAFATENPSESISEEKKRKVRISAGAFQSMFLLKELLNVTKYGKLSFQYISHRVLRWAVCPFLIPVVLILNILIVKIGSSMFYTYMLILQLCFYLLSIIGWQLSKTRWTLKLTNAAYYFLFINLSLYAGFFRFLKNRQTVLWEKAGRKH